MGGREAILCDNLAELATSVSSAVESRMANSIVRQHWFFTGRVQGVGFRATTAEIASQFAVTGYVQNMSDGRVSLTAEATPAELAAFLEAVQARLGPKIDHAEQTQQPATNEFDAFIVRY